MRKPINILICVLLAGCVASPGPSIEGRTARMGQAEPVTTDYVLFIPEGSKVPVMLTLHGNLLRSQTVIETRIESSRDIYLYRDLASSDGKHWRTQAEMFDIGLALGANTEGLAIHMSMEERP